MSDKLSKLAAICGICAFIVPGGAVAIIGYLKRIWLTRQQLATTLVIAIVVAAVAWTVFYFIYRKYKTKKELDGISSRLRFGIAILAVTSTAVGISLATLIGVEEKSEILQDSKHGIAATTQPPPVSSNPNSIKRLEQFYHEVIKVEIDADAPGKTCEEFVKAADKIQKADRGYANKEQLEYIKRADECRRIIAESDQRLNDVRRAREFVYSYKSIANIKAYIDKKKRLQEFDRYRSTFDRLNNESRSIDSDIKTFNDCLSLLRQLDTNMTMDDISPEKAERVRKIYKRLAATGITWTRDDLGQEDYGALQAANNIANELSDIDAKFEKIVSLWNNRGRERDSLFDILYYMTDYERKRWDRSEGTVPSAVVMLQYLLDYFIKKAEKDKLPSDFARINEVLALGNEWGVEFSPRSITAVERLRQTGVKSDSAPLISSKKRDDKIGDSHADKLENKDLNDVLKKYIFGR